MSSPPRPEGPPSEEQPPEGPPPEGPRPEGLRERKKAKTRWAIQEHALRLFAEQGYEATTVEQIAEAAEVSPSTFFRYFPAKEDVVVRNEYDALIVSALRGIAPGAAPVDAFRQAVRAAFEDFGPGDLAWASARARLILSVPALRARQLQAAAGTHAVMCAEIASRTGRDPRDLDVETFAAAVIGVMIPAVGRWAANPSENLPDLLDAALTQLAAGLPLTGTP
ncbi:MULTISPECIES: acyl-CoA-like ligand-binding transcription factor [unclassified Streptosporangium]|uniref:acyl-CoA-like ligand-binding transcription factor n=1 Tax=unclassified Streptosporangium TaxID=2632669 RepID=UPI002E2E1B4C|nr:MULTISPECIES: TetR family transcriptional regulator [unclassified Streptosporangium]